jgi:hypothetical protein
MEEKKATPVFVQDVSDKKCYVAATALRDAYRNRMLVPGLRAKQVKYHHVYYTNTWNVIYTLLLLCHCYLAMLETRDWDNSANIIEWCIFAFYVVDLGIYWSFQHQALLHPRYCTKLS